VNSDPDFVSRPLELVGLVDGICNKRRFRMAPERTVIKGSLPDLKARPCCLLVEHPVPILALIWPNHILDLHDNLAHKSGTSFWGWFRGKETSGLIYTCLGGFIDLGHLRDFADLTRIYYYQLLKQPREDGVIKEGTVFNIFPTHNNLTGVVTVRKDIPAGQEDIDILLNIARSVAYDVSIMYEISTYPVISILDPGKHASAFSPEDLVSNFLGTHIAAKAIRKEIVGGSESSTAIYDREVANELRNLLGKLKPLDKAGAIQALDNIGDRWIRTGVIVPGLDTLHLKRRNFIFEEITPWIVSDVDGCDSSPVFFPDDIERKLPDETRSFYTIFFNFAHDFFEGVEKTSDSFDLLIEKIKTDARVRYGSEFDQP
jgi:hypothetical protein